ncbi:MAG: hypothetical protein ACOX6W_06360 [Lentisphaeria bacterium]|jgi:hypothetical protein
MKCAFAFNIQHSALSIQHSTFSIQHSAFNIQHSTFSIQHSAPRPSPLAPRPSKKPFAVGLIFGVAGLRLYVGVFNNEFWEAAYVFAL